MSKRWTTEDVRKLRNASNVILSGFECMAEVSEVKAEMKAKRKNRKHEQKLQIQIATYLKLKHPEIIFYSDVASGCKLTIGQAVLNKRMQYSRALPDMFIAHTNRTWGGLFIELKKSKEEVYRKDGSIREDEHIKEQDEMLKQLIIRGFKAVFACGFDEAISIIENYLNEK